jgi:PAS domain S-box-containing protein
MDAAQRQISTIAIVGMGFSILMAIFLGNYFARQLKSLRDAARSIASGNIGYQIFMKGEDELAQTANAFNTMSRKLALLYSEKQAALNEAEDRAVNLREKERRIKAILENAGDGIITIDEHGDVESFNATAERMFGYTQNEIVGENVKLLMGEQERAAHDGYLSEYMKTGERHMMVNAREVTARHKDGTLFPMELDVSEMVIEGQRLFIGIARDITERKLAEEKLQKAQQATIDAARAKFEFIANISHEIRSPMNGVLSMINLLEGSRLSHQQREYVAHIHDSSSALITIINDILDFSRLEAGQLDLEAVDFDIEQTIVDVCRLLGGNATSKGLELVYMINGNVPTGLIGDPARMRQILVNLVDNAIKFTDSGIVTLKVGLVDEQEDTVSLHFSLTDTGIGLSPRVQRSILEGGDEDLRARGEGRKGSIGLGLAIVRKLVQLMGGEIGIESERGEGSTFWFRLPLRRQMMVAGPQLTSRHSEFHGLRALVIDSREVWSAFLYEQMSEFGMTVTLATEAERGLEQLREASDQDQPFDLVIFDMMIPDSSGLELAETIRTDIRIAPLRMIMIATTGYRGDSEEVRRVGITGYLSTPISSDQLYDCIDAVMNLPANDETTLITRHSIADRHASQRDHILSVLPDEDDQRQLLYLLQQQERRSHYVSDISQVSVACSRHYYGCVLLDCRGLTPAACRKRVNELRSALHVEHQVHVLAIIEAADMQLSEDYLAAGVDALLSWPVSADDLEQQLACRPLSAVKNDTASG